jgi:hypothetical protein
LTASLSPFRQQDHYPRGGVICSLASSLRMAIPLPTTTSRRNPPFTWCSACVVVCKSSSRPSLARRPVVSQLAASPTNFPLEDPSHDKSPPRTTSLRLAQQVFVSHDKSLPHTRSPAPTGAWARTHDSSDTTNAYGGANLHVMQNTTAGGHADGSPRQEP